MRFVWCVALLGLSSVSVAQPVDLPSAQQAYRAQLAAQCPSKRLDLLSPAEVRDVLDDYKARLSARIGHEMTRAEDRRCSNSPGGASCPNASDLEVAERHHIVAQVASQTCNSFVTCHEQSDCDAVSDDTDQDDTAMQIAADVRSKGARAAAAELSENDWDRALASAASGNVAWLRVLVSIRPATDGAQSEGIDRALSFGLATNPAAVLRLMRAHPETMRPAWLCQYRAIEPTPASVGKFTDDATAALGRVNDPDLASLRDRCVANLHKMS